MRGLNLTLPPDLQKDTAPYLLNMRQYPNGEFRNRPGLLGINSAVAAGVHSIVRLNNYFTEEFARYVGAGTVLYSNDPSNVSTLVSRATAFSGNPLSLVVMRPPQSPEPWL